MAIPKIFNKESDKKNWANRRKEILALFEDYEYGKVPEMTFDRQGCVLLERLELKSGRVKESYGYFFQKDKNIACLKFDLVLRESEKKLPVIMQVDPFANNPLFVSFIKNFNPKAKLDERFPMYDFADEGIAAINVDVGSLAFDDPVKSNFGMLELYPPEGDNGWCALGVWAWAMSRVVDFIYSDKRFDTSKIIIAGCSRAGKTALWAAAQDERITGVFASVSGCCGSAMHRGKTGERIASIVKEFPHWSCKKLKEYGEREEDLPLAQHMLLALIAPRPLYITSASEDDWACPKKEFESCVLASEAYTNLGKPGLSSFEFPKVNSPIKEGTIAYHLREGEHGCKTYDWENVLPFMRRELNF